jgi:hypothetical protein
MRMLAGLIRKGFMAEFHDNGCGSEVPRSVPVIARRRFAAVSIRVLLRCLPLSVLSALVLFGCAVNAPVDPDDDRQAHAETVLDAIRDVPRVDRVLLDDRHLWISFTAGGRQNHASATLEPIADRLLATLGKQLPVRALVSVDPGAGNTLQPDSAPVPVHGPPAWRALLDDSLQTLTPHEAGQGAVVDILQEDELFLYRIEGGALVAVPIIYKPPDIQVQRTYTFQDLLQVMRGRLAGDYPDGGSLLFETGDDSRYGYPFVYVEVSSGQILFLRYMPDPGYAESMALGTTVEVFTQTLIDHIRAFFNQPVSSFSRLFTMVASTTADLAKPTPLTLLEHELPPPLRPGEAMDPM